MASAPGRSRSSEPPILVAEDDRFMRKAVQTTLERGGHAVVTANDGEEALKVARDRQPRLVILDLIMPKVQGFEVLRELKTDPATREIPVIVLSNLGQERDKERTLGEGAVAYLVKADLSLDELARVVDRVLGGAP